LNNLILKGHK